MTIKKPPDVRNWLYSLNIKVFAWEWNVGDWIEDAIDWALGWINWAIERAGLAYSKAVEAFYKAVEVGNELVRTINIEISRVYNKISTWWDDLGEWWSTKVTWVKDQIAAARDTLRGLINDVRGALAPLLAAWDNFRTATLPRLIDLSWWTSFWGGAFNHISDWWAGRRQEITDRIDTEVTPVRDEVNKHIGIFDLVKQLTTDPLAWPEYFARWVLSMLESIIARLW